MGKLRKVMKGKYNSEEREMKINTSEVSQVVRAYFQDLNLF